MKNMKKSTKTTLIVALCLFGAGLLICLGAFIAGGCSFSKMTAQFDSNALVSDSEYEQIEETFSNSGKEIELELNCAHVDVAPSDDGKIHITYTTGPSGSFDLDENSERISLRQRNPKVFGLVLDRSCVELLVPDDYKGDLEISTTSGSVVVENLRQRGETEIGCTSGSVKVLQCSFHSISAEATSGHISAEGIEASDSIELGATSGGISLSGASVKELECDANSGGISLQDIKADKLSAATTTGSIRLSAADAKDLSLAATSGRISGSLAGSEDDYTVYSRTTTGRNSLEGHRGTGSRSLDATTTSGRISIEFGA